MLIQRLTVALGDPQGSAPAGVVAPAGWHRSGWRRATPLAVSVAAAVVLAYTVAGGGAVPWLLGLTRVPRVTAIVLLLAPLGAALGVAFPLGLRLLAPQPATRALAWAANGCASVVGAVASTLLAVAQGITALGLVAGAGYVCAALIAAAMRRSKDPPL